MVLDLRLELLLLNPNTERHHPKYSGLGGQEEPGTSRWARAEPEKTTVTVCISRCVPFYHICEKNIFFTTWIASCSIPVGRGAWVRKVAVAAVVGRSLWDHGVTS